MKQHRVLLALAISLAMVAVLATLFPRIYLVNDDVGLTDYLRRDEHVPWMSPILQAALGFAYQRAPGVPWYGLYLYTLLVIGGAVLIHTCMELIDRRSGPGNVATLLGAQIFIASHAIVVVGITWTTVSITATGIAAAAAIAHALICQSTGAVVSWRRALVYGLLLAGGYMVRSEGLDAVVVVFAPVAGWMLLRFVRRRYLPRVIALLAFVAPFALVLATQGRIPIEQESSDFEAFNDARGRIHGHARFERLDERAPELLARAGWTIEEYQDFTSWRFIDEQEFSTAKVQRLVATQGVPQAIDAAWGYRQLRGVFEDSTVSVLLLLMVVVAAAGLAWSGAVGRRAVIASVGYVAYLTAVVLWISMRFRFPQRVSIAFLAVAALGLFVFLACQIADRPAASTAPSRDRRNALTLAIVALLGFGWARSLIAWIDRDPLPYAAELAALEDRVAARNGFIFVSVQAGQVHHDPLHAVARGYDGLGTGWGTFSATFYRQIARLGVHRGGDVFRAMVDNPDAYLLSAVGARGVVEDWIRRQLHDPAVRLALVDAAAIADGSRPELYRLVTTPLARGTEEWRALERREAKLAELLPRAPAIALELQPVAFGAPYDQHLSPLRDPAQAISVAPIDGGLRVETGGAGDCTPRPATVQRAGIHIPVAGLGAARFEVKLIEPAHVDGLEVVAQTATGRSIRWRWDRPPETQVLGFDGAFTVVPGHPAQRLQLAVSRALPRDIIDLHIYVTAKAGTRAGFELRHVMVAKP